MKSNNGEPKPGQFFTGPDEKPQPAEAVEVRELKPEIHPDLVAKYRAFIEALSPKANVVYHPSNSTDVSPSEAFPKSRVIYVDIDEQAVNALQRSGYESHFASATDPIVGNLGVSVYRPDVPVDILIMLNPQIDPDIPSQYVTEGGYVLANDYHNTATQLKDNPKFELVGIIRASGGHEKYILDKDQPENYWKPIDTEEEFRNSPFTWGSVNYDTAKQVVELLTGKTDNILTEYKKIIEQAKEDEQRKYTDRLANREEGFKAYLGDLKSFGADVEAMTPPELEAARRAYDDMLEQSDPKDQTDFVINLNGRTIVIDTDLPRKKGVTDDYFVFKKLAEKVSPDTHI